MRVALALGIFVSVSLELVSAQATAAGQPLPSPVASLTPAELEDGRRLFRIHCARCHGMLGEGGEGPSLKRPHLRHAPDDQALFDVLNDGIMGTGMPPTFGPNEDEMWRLAGYVRTLGRLPAESMPGDPDIGRQIYENEGGCPECHIVSGRGRGIGPELTDIGSRRNRLYLREALLEPDANQPRVSRPLLGNVHAYLTVHLVAEDAEYEGLRINEDEFSVQLRLLDGRIRSFDRHALLDYKRVFGYSLMPGYEATLSREDINHLVAYLMSLKGTIR